LIWVCTFFASLIHCHLCQYRIRWNEKFWEEKIVVWKSEKKNYFWHLMALIEGFSFKSELEKHFFLIWAKFFHVQLSMKTVKSIRKNGSMISILTFYPLPTKMKINQNYIVAEEREKLLTKLMDFERCSAFLCQTVSSNTFIIFESFFGILLAFFFRNLLRNFCK
jgi:hypothetical protein